MGGSKPSSAKSQLPHKVSGKSVGSGVAVDKVPPGVRVGVGVRVPDVDGPLAVRTSEIGSGDGESRPEDRSPHDWAINRRGRPVGIRFGQNPGPLGLGWRRVENRAI